MNKQELIDQISYYCSVLLDSYRGKDHAEFEVDLVGSKELYDLLGSKIKVDLYYYQGLGCVSMKTVFASIEVSVLYSTIRMNAKHAKPFIIVQSDDLEKPLIMYLEKLEHKS